MLLGLLLAVPLTVLTSRRTAGETARRAGLFLTPEEVEPSEDLVLLRSMEKQSKAESGTLAPAGNSGPWVIADPYLNALHVTLLRRDAKVKGNAESLRALSKGERSISELKEKAVAEGFDALSSKEQLLVLSDATTVESLHKEVWTKPWKKLPAHWTDMLRGYARPSAAG